MTRQLTTLDPRDADELVRLNNPEPDETNRDIIICLNIRRKTKSAAQSISYFFMGFSKIDIDKTAEEFNMNEEQKTRFSKLVEDLDLVEINREPEPELEDLLAAL